MGFNAVEERDRLRKERAECFYGRRYFYTTARDGHQIIGVLRGLGEMRIVGYIRETGSRKALKIKRLWPTKHAEDIQNRLDEWAKDKGLTEAV